MRNCFFFLLVFSSALALAQDTIVKKNREKIPAKVLFVGEEIRYRKSNNPDGPVYSEKSSDIFRILYANGSADSVFYQTPSQVVVPHVEKDKIFLTSSGYYYKDRKMFEKRILTIAESNSPDIHLIHEIDRVRYFKRKQYSSLIAGAGLLAFGGGCAFIAFFTYTTDGQNSFSDTGYGMAAVLGTAGVGSEICSILFERQRTKHARKMAELYNASLGN